MIRDAQTRIRVAAAVVAVMVLVSCSRRTNAGNRPDPVRLEPVVLEYWVDANAFPASMRSARVDKSSVRLLLQDLLNPQVSVSTGGLSGQGSSSAQSSGKTPENELAERIMSLIESTAAEVMVTAVGSWEVSDHPAPSLDLLIDWDTLHQAAPDTFSNNPAPKLHYPDLVLDLMPHAEKMIAEGIYEPVSPQVRATAPDLRSAYPEQVWTDAPIGGETYCLPVHTGTWPRFWVIRKDIREKAGVDPVTTYHDLMALTDSVLRAGDLDKPLIAQSSSELLFSIMGYYEIHPALWNSSPADHYVSYLLYRRGNDPTVRLLADTMDEEVLEAFEIYARLVGDDLVEYTGYQSYYSGDPSPALLMADWIGVYAQQEDAAVLEAFRETHPQSTLEVFA